MEIKDIEKIVESGKAKLNLPVNRKLVNVTWKADELWYLSRDMTQNDIVETYKFQEKSSWGVMEGTYIIKESRSIQTDTNKISSGYRVIAPTVK